MLPAKRKTIGVVHNVCLAHCQTKDCPATKHHKEDLCNICNWNKEEKEKIAPLKELHNKVEKQMHPNGKFRLKYVIDKSDTYVVNDKEEMLNVVLWVAKLDNGQIKIIVKTDTEEEIFNVNYPTTEIHCPNCDKWYEPTVPSREEAQQATIAKEQWMTGICSDKCWNEYLGDEE